MLWVSHPGSSSWERTPVELFLWEVKESILRGAVKGPGQGRLLPTQYHPAPVGVGAGCPESREMVALHTPGEDCFWLDLPGGRVTFYGCRKRPQAERCSCWLLDLPEVEDLGLQAEDPQRLLLQGGGEKGEHCFLRRVAPVLMPQVLC